MKKGFKRRWIKVLTGMTSIMLIMTVVSMPTMAYEPPQGSQCSNSQPTKSFVVNPPGVVKLDELDKYMTIDENYKLHFDTKQAIKDSLPPRIIYFGLKAERVNNKMIYELKTYEEVSEETIREIETLYGPSFKYISSQPLDKYQTRAEACGGGYDNPHDCPPRLDSGIYRDTRDDIVDYLLDNGLHIVPRYASYDYGDDYAKVVSAYGCGGGPFRHQAWPSPSGSVWTYRYQTPEPNPEIFSYWWPAYWWGPYVQWWHRNYC